MSIGLEGAQTWPTGEEGLVHAVSLMGSGARRAAAGQVVGNPLRSRLMVSGKGELAVHCPLSGAVTSDKAANIGGRPGGCGA